MANLRDFRRRVSALKKAGIVNVDARSALPDSKVKGKRLDTLIEKYDAVASGKAAAVKVSPSKLKQYRKAGYETAAGRVIVPHSATETVAVKKGNVVIRRGGMQRIQIPCPYEDLEQYLKCMMKHASKLNALKEPNEYFGFKFFGNNSTEFFPNIQAMIRKLRDYQSVISANSRIKQQKIYKNIEVFRLSKSAAREWESTSETKRKKMSKAYNRKKQKEFRAKLERKPKHKRDAYRAAAAERMKAYRARLKKNRKAYADYKKDARLRAKKSDKKAQAKLKARKRAAKKRSAKRKK